MNKKAITYLRFSSAEQSHFSIERQEMITGSWMKHAQVDLIDCFEDRGYSATNFDRPDYKKLYAFVRKNYREIDYLVVSDLTRFSREAGDAINTVKSIQKTYGIRIVSAGRGNIYDCNDHNSFLMMGLEFLLGNVENLKRMNDINSGIYAAKAVKHRYIGAHAPFGYKKEGRGKNTILVIVEEEAAIIRYIYSSYLNNVSIATIAGSAKNMGLRGTKHDLIEMILRCPVYSSQQYVKAYKEEPGGLYPIKDQQPIIDLETWTRVQEKINRKTRNMRYTVSDELPLRGVLHCHCGKLLTGAPSKGRHGKYFYYYKCHVSSKHNNISVKKSNDQFWRALGYMSLPEKMINSILLRAEQAMEARLSDRKRLLSARKAELEKVDTDLHNLERKWISDQISKETYHRWSADFSKQHNYLKAQIERLSNNENVIYNLLRENLGKLSDLQAIFKMANTPQKHELIRKGFDDRLYYQDNVYRTPYIIPELAHNELILKDKGLLIIDKKGGNFAISPLSGGEGSRTPVQTSSPKAFYMLILAIIVGKRQEPDTPIVSLAV